MASFLLFFFGITKNRRFGRLVYCLRDSVLQNNDFSHKKGVLFDAIPMFLCFSASCSTEFAPGSDFVM